MALPSLRHLQHLRMLAEERNFSRAAQRAHLSQPAFSRSIQVLEARLALKLFDRSGREVRLTPVGEQVAAHARRLLFEAGNVEHDLALLRDARLGTVAFGAGPNVASSVLAPVLARLRNEHPAVELRVQLDSGARLLEHLLAERLEFFVAEHRDLPVSREVCVSRIARHAAACYCRPGHPILALARPGAAEVARWGYATVSAPAAIRQALLAAFGRTEAEGLPQAVQCDNLFVLGELVARSDTLLLTTDITVHELLAAGRLVPVPLGFLAGLYSEWAVVQLEGRALSPAAAAVLQALREETARLVPSSSAPTGRLSGRRRPPGRPRPPGA